MAININSGSYFYRRRDGKFLSTWAAMRSFVQNQSLLRSASILVPTRYSMDGEVYAAHARTNVVPDSMWIVNSGSTSNLFDAKSTTARADVAYDKPFIICVTYDTFSNMPKTNITSWRELGVSASKTGSTFGFTDRAIIPDAMANYIYITGIYVFDNSDDGNYSASNPRAVLNNYEIFTPAVIDEMKLYRNGEALNNANTGVYLISLNNFIAPYYAATFNYAQSPTSFNVMTAAMNYLKMPISNMIQIVGLNSSNQQKVRATLYKTPAALKKDVYSWGVPFTFSYDEALYNNTGDFTDDPGNGQPENPSGGGGGNGDNIDDPIEFPETPFSPSSLGGYLSLVQSPSELAGLTSVLWKPVIRDLSDALKVYFNTDNLTNSVLSIMYYPLDLAAMPLGLTHSDNIRIAWSTDNISADIMSNNVSHEINAGYYDVAEYYGSFLDYSPYTTVDIWLPYIGYKPLDIDAIMGKTIRVKYFVDFVDGLATAVIFANEQPINNYTGQLGIDLAVTGRDNAAKVRQTIDSVMTAVTGVNKAVGGVTQGAAQAYAGNVGGSVNALGGVATTLTNVGMTGLQTAVQQPQTVIYGTAGGENWLSMPQKCHLKFTRAVAASPASYIDEMGYPTTYTDIVSKFTGYLKCASVFGDFTGIPAEDADEIQVLLQGGVHISEGAFQ